MVYDIEQKCFQNKMKELDLKEKSSKSLLANVLDMDDDFVPSSSLPTHPPTHQKNGGFIRYPKHYIILLLYKSEKHDYVNRIDWKVILHKILPFSEVSSFRCLEYLFHTLLWPNLVPVLSSADLFATI